MNHHHPTRLVPRPLALAALTALAAPAVQAQVIDELTLRREGKDAVMTIRMSVQVQFRRSVTSGADDLVQLYYDVLTSRERPNFIEGERRGLQLPGLPRLTVTEDGSGPALADRKLVIRSDKAVRMRARAGRDNRSFEVLLEGLGEAANATASPVLAAAPTGGAPADAEITARAAQLIGLARESVTRGEPELAIEQLNEALNLPPNPRTPDAQEAIAAARLARGDRAGAQREAELYLQLYPSGSGARNMRALLADLAAGSGSAPAPVASAGETGEPTRRSSQSQLTGSLAQYFYGGASQTRTQFEETLVDGILKKPDDAVLSGIDQKQISSAIDLSWRQRDADRDLRAAFRDSHIYDMMPNRPSRNRLTAAYVDWRESGPGLQARVGRQSGLGGGVLGRFDGIQGSWAFKPKWKLGAVAGQPTDDLAATRRYFGGVQLDAEALTENLGGSTYLIQQQIDGEVDRRAAGLDLRWFEGATSVFSQYEYDLMLRGTNVASLQGTTTLSGGTTLNMLFDYRAVPLLMLGNALYFSTDGTQPRTLDDVLRLRSLADLRRYVTSTTAYSKQGLLGVTQPITPQWQVGADIRLTSTGAIAPVPSIGFPGAPATGNIWSGSLQLIGTNLYSERDTHVWNLTLFKSPTNKGWQLSYNNMSVPWQRLQVEPSLRIYGDNNAGGTRTTRWAPGLRAAWRGGEKWVLEGEVSAESSRTTGPTQNENATRVFYYLGYRLDL